MATSSEWQFYVNVIIKWPLNDNFFAEAIYYFNKSLENGKSPNFLKLANVTPVLKKAYVHQK